MKNEIYRLLEWAQKRKGAVILIAQDDDDIEVVEGHFGKEGPSAEDRIKALRLVANQMERTEVGGK